MKFLRSFIFKKGPLAILPQQALINAVKRGDRQEVKAYSDFCKNQNISDGFRDNLIGIAKDHSSITDCDSMLIEVIQEGWIPQKRHLLFTCFNECATLKRWDLIEKLSKYKDWSKGLANRCAWVLLVKNDTPDHVVERFLEKHPVEAFVDALDINRTTYYGEETSSNYMTVFGAVSRFGSSRAFLQVLLQNPGTILSGKDCEGLKTRTKPIGVNVLKELESRGVKFEDIMDHYPETTFQEKMKLLEKWLPSLDQDIKKLRAQQKSENEHVILQSQTPQTAGPTLHISSPRL